MHFGSADWQKRTLCLVWTRCELFIYEKYQLTNYLPIILKEIELIMDFDTLLRDYENDVDELNYFEDLTFVLVVVSFFSNISARSTNVLSNFCK